MNTTSAILTNKLITIGSNVTLAGAIVVPVLFSISDIMTEIYGYKIAKNIIIFAFLCQIIFAIITFILSHLSSPSYWHGQNAYDFVLGPVIRISIASFIAYFLSSTLNIYILSRWKYLWQGKLFWVRSLGSSTIGELLFTVLAVISIKHGELPWNILLDIIVVSYLIKIIGSVVCSILASIAVFYITIKLNHHYGLQKTLGSEYNS